MNNDPIIPVLSLVITPTLGEDPDRLEREILRLLDENSELRVKAERREDRFVIAGEDEVQLEEFCGAIALVAHIEVGELRIAFRETIRKQAEAEGKYIRQTGGSGNYGHCWLRIEPNEPGKGYEFINGIKGGVVPKEYIKPIDQGIQGALELGILAGFPIVDVKVTLFDGSYHEVDSNEMAFKFAGSIAFKEAARRASPVLLEPVMAVEVTVPEEFMGVIISDINSRRGRITKIDRHAESTAVSAIVPLAEMLRSSRNGRPNYEMRLAGFEPAHRGDFDGDDAPIFAVKPGSPKSGRGNAVARREEF